MKKGPKPKRFCVRGHDTEIVGRNSQSACKECIRIKRRDPKKVVNPRKQFCPQGHDTFVVGRATNGCCNICKNAQDKKSNLKSRLKNIEKRRQRGREYYFKHKEQMKLTTKKWIENHREQYNSRMRKFHREHPQAKRLVNLKTKINRKSRIPKFGQKGIKIFVRNIPNDMTIDHIVPLQGEFVSGLHVIWNLQYLTLSENCSKGNKINLLKVSEWYGKILEDAGLK